VVEDDGDAEPVDGAQRPRPGGGGVDPAGEVERLRQRAGKEQVRVALVELEAMPAVLQVAAAAPREFPPILSWFRLSVVTCANGPPTAQLSLRVPTRFAPYRAAWRRAEGRWREIPAAVDQDSAPIPRRVVPLPRGRTQIAG
jgi:hypothetical protein